MRDQLIQYVNLLFAGSEDAEDIRQEILQNTLDRYDDLLDQGKTPEAAYRLAITGIGDINEILHGQPSFYTAPEYREEPVYTQMPVFSDWDPAITKLIRAVAIGLYILCPIPVILLDAIGFDVFGVCIMLVMIAAATVLLIAFSRKNTVSRSAQENPGQSPRKALKKSIRSLIDVIGLALYFIISFATGAWHITWLIFPIMGAVNGLVKACLDLKEEI